MSKRTISLVIAGLIVISGLLGFITFESDVVSAGSIIYVGSGVGNDSATINGGIGLAQPGDTVFVYSGTYIENVVVDKTLNLTGENRDTTIIDGGNIGYGIQISTLSYVNISGFTVKNGATYGIYIYLSTYCKIENNIISNNNGKGLMLFWYSDNNSVENNIFKSKSDDCIELNNYCDYNTIANNTMEANDSDGILLSSTNANNKIRYNKINDSNIGIYFWNSNTDNIIIGNTVSNSSFYGIYLWSSNSQNKIYHNNFLTNVNQAFDDGTNIWDNGYPNGGNFWGDYSGGDNRSGPAQNIPGNDGFGDVSYNIPGGANIDNYPLWPNWNALELYIPSPSRKEVCEYALGSVKVAVIFMESNGSIDTESEDWSLPRKTTVISEVQEALTWWEGLEANASLTFSILDVGSKNTGYEPITHPHTNDSLWIGEIMDSMGYTTGTYLEKVQSYNHWLRGQYNTDWAFTIFVADSFNDIDGNFSDLWSGYGYWSYGCVIMTYDNGEWGISRMNNVTAHETGHMFYATDEYNGFINYNGYLNEADSEWSGCLMHNNNLALSSGTKLQIGWRDIDNDGIMDILDTEPNTYLISYKPDPTMDNTPTYTGYAVVVPYPNNNPSGSGRDVTLNTITNVQYQIDAGPWINAIPTDGTFDEAIESFQFTTFNLISGVHYIVARAVNSVNNNDSTFANDTITILFDNEPPEIEDTSFGIPSTGDYYNITANVIDNVEVDTVWLEFTITSSEGYFETYNLSMNKSIEPSYWYKVNIWSNVTWFNYTIKANDTSDNWNSTSIINLAFRVHNLDTGENFFTIQEGIYDSDTLDGHTIYVENGIYYENVVVNKSLNLTGEDRENTIIDGGGSGNVVRIIADWVNITGFTVKRGALVSGYAGIKLENVQHCIISNNDVTSNWHGVRLESSSNNTITNNDIYSNIIYGISLPISSNDNEISYNFISNNDVGINLDNFCSLNVIFNNTVINNNYGIGLDDSINNIIYHNNIIKNIYQAYDGSLGNQWDNGYPSGGNFWSNYTGIDRFSGPGQIIPGNDGIGDTDYLIIGGELDNYPLMAPIGNCIFLYQGWNLVSIPFIQSDTNLDSVLSSITGDYDALQWFNISDNSDPWKHNHISKPSNLNDLGGIDHTMGFWIHITRLNGTLFEYPGIQPSENKTIALSQGWNLVGYPSLTRYIRTDGLNNVTFDTHVNSIWTFNSAAKKWEEVRGIDYFMPGKGYWVHAQTDCVWEVPI
jgi:parallel beta-helix repeat protein